MDIKQIKIRTDQHIWTATLYGEEVIKTFITEMLSCAKEVSAKDNNKKCYKIVNDCKFVLREPIGIEIMLFKDFYFVLEF